MKEPELNQVKVVTWSIPLEHPHHQEHEDAYGRELVAAGTPEAVAAVEASWTGRYLKPLLERDRARQKKLAG
ncbi:MAG: hypothetical protein JJU18_03915 [Oceanicaulis sp.]|nr:hypothetical protein [Oceanicaulis sp.]